MQPPSYCGPRPPTPSHPKGGRTGTIAAVGCGALLVAGIATAGVLFAPDILARLEPPHPTAYEVCEKLKTAGVAEHCRSATPGGLGSAARQRVEFDIPGEKRTGQVLTFDRDDFYESTVRAFGAAAALAGRHQYGNPGALVFVQLNSETSDATGDAARRVVAGL